MTAQLIGREGVFEQLVRFVDSADGARATSLVLEGDAGIGKTTLWRAGVDHAAAGGRRVLFGRPVEHEADLAFAGLADLLSSVEPSFLADLPGPQTHSLEVALLLAEPGLHPVEPRAVFTAFLSILSKLAEQTPILVAVDDLQWIDPSSRKALEFVARRIEGRPIQILAAARADERRRAPLLPAAEVLHVGELTPAAIHELVKSRLGVSLPPPTLLRVHDVAAGNPFYALALAEVLVAAGLPAATELWPVPGDLSELVATRVAGLSRAAREALLTAAARGDREISATPELLAKALRAGIVERTGNGGLRFSHPLYSSAVYASASDAERQRIHNAIAAEAGDIEEHARHSALGASGPDETVGALLEQAASHASARGAPHVAAELAERAIRLTPADQPDRARERTVLCAEYAFRSGDLVRARDLLVDVTTSPTPDVRLSHALRLLGEAAYRLGDVDLALGSLRRAVEAGSGDPVATAAAELDSAFVLFYSLGSFEEANAAVGRALVTAEARGDPILISICLAFAAVSRLLLGHGLDEDAFARALALEDMDQPAPIERRPSMFAGWGLLQTEQLDGARVVLHRLRDHLVEHGEETDLPELLATLARLEWLGGRLEEGRQLAQVAYRGAQQAESVGPAASALGSLALVEATAGRAAEARSAAAEAQALAASSGWWLAGFWATVALALLDLSLGDPEAVLAELGPSLRLVEAERLPEPSRAPYLPDAIEAMVELGELDRAERFAALLTERGRAVGRQSAIVAGARCTALVLAARRDVPAALATLDPVLPVAERLPLPFETARTFLVKGQLERRMKHKREARDALERSVALFRGIGAELWTGRAETEFARVGAGPSPGELTATEARIAELAAGGLTNHQIAAAAFISQKTVEANLSRIYRKLGIRSRAELGVRLLDVSEANPEEASQPGSAPESLE